MNPVAVTGRKAGDAHGSGVSPPGGAPGGHAVAAYSTDPEAWDSKANLDKIASLVADVRTPRHGDDFVLCRFLRAEKGDVESAAARYRVTQAWRVENRCDDLLDGPFPFEEAYRWLAPHGCVRLRCMWSGPSGGTLVHARPCVRVAYVSHGAYTFWHGASAGSTRCPATGTCYISVRSRLGAANARACVLTRSRSSHVAWPCRDPLFRASGTSGSARYARRV